MIEAEGVGSFCEDLQVDPADIVMVRERERGRYEACDRKPLRKKETTVKAL